ncbi:MAG: hypothetical protein Q9227_007835 [Pyrenula ochraceoflavens]
MGRSKKRRRSQFDDGEELRQSENSVIRSFPEDIQPPSLPSGINHYETPREVPFTIKSYWRQRHQIFSRYDHGIWMTDDLWYGVTQECVARKIAHHVSEATPSDRVILIDAMAGAGGNTIAFAKDDKWKRVYALEANDKNLSCARKNAEVYNVHDRVTWFEGDCFQIIEGLEMKELAQKYGVIFCSPPWGGPEYRADTIFDLDAMQPYSLQKLYYSFKKFSDYIVMYLPRTSDLQQIAELVGKGEKAQIIHYCTDGRSKALCAYLGPFGSIRV